MNRTYEQKDWLLSVEGRNLVARDGVRVFYEVVGQGDQTIVLANGLGGRLYSWEPLIRALAPYYRIITWDYRGLFESQSPSRIRRLAIPEHAEDLKEILDQEGIRTAICMGWSMGVQVCLEMTSLYPEYVECLVLINGTHGKALQTAYQPIFRVPGVENMLHGLIDWASSRPAVTEKLGRFVMSLERPLRKGGRLWGKLYGSDRIEIMLWQYLSDVFATDFGNYLRLFLELDAHSTFHLLRSIDKPTLIISGLLDFLTPAYLSAEMARKLPDARHVVLRLGSHFVLAEFPNDVIGHIESFLADTHATP